MGHFGDRIRISIQPRLYLLLAAVILMIPIRWGAAWIIAGVIHELGHFTAIRLSGKKIYGLSLDWNGMVMHTEDLGNCESWCALAGPLAGGVLLFFCRWFPRLAICAWMQMLINLLPIYPMDGGRAVRGLLRLWLSPDTVIRATEYISYGTITGLAVMLAVLVVRFGIHPLMVGCAILLCFKALIVKSTCKDDRLRVQ